MGRKKVIAITGGSSGLGLELAQKLSSAGNIVYAGFNSHKPLVKNNNLSFLKLDVTSDPASKNFIKHIYKKEGRIDVLINCAGVSQAGETLEFTSEDFLHILQVNTLGPFRLTKEVVPLMIKKGGVIINITSMNGLMSFPHTGLYSASKFGLEALSFALRQELSSKNIKVISIAPGFFIKSAVSEVNSDSLLRTLFPYTTQEDVSQRIVNLIKQEQSPPRLIVGVDAQLVNFLNRILPLSVVDKIINYVWNKKGSLALRK